MAVLCKKCGHDNPLGRVFCGACGVKLDLVDMSSQAVASKQKVSPVIRVGPVVVVLVVAVLLLAAVLAAIPNTGLVGEKGTSSNGQRVVSPLRAMARLGQRRSLGRTFREADINGYLQFNKARDMGLDSMSVKILDGCMIVRVVRTLGPLDLGKFSLGPKLSYDLVCVPVEGGLRVSKASLGHLPMVGPAKSGVVRSVQKRLATQKEWAAFEHLKKIEAKEGTVSVEVAR